MKQFVSVLKHMYRRYQLARAQRRSEDCARAYAERGNITDIRRLNRNQNT